MPSVTAPHPIGAGGLFSPATPARVRGAGTGMRRRLSSFHNRRATELQGLASSGGGTSGPTDNQMEHLRQLQARQFQLLSSHSTLTSSQVRGG
jgi:hypothetical protein